jgi:hypothetical protein
LQHFTKGKLRFSRAFYEQLNIKAGIRNYAKSIREITLELKRLKNKAGAVILVVKTGPESNKGTKTN